MRELLRIIQDGDFANLPEEAHAAFADLVRKVRKLAESIEDPLKRAGALERLKLMDR